MRTPPLFTRALAVAVFAVAFGLAASSCSDPVEDSIGEACKVITGCVDISMGQCIDNIGSELPSCTDCIAQSTCSDYSSCQRDVAGCRIPTILLP